MSPGLGIGGFYRFHAKSELETGALVRVLQEFEVGDGAIYVTPPPAKFPSRGTKAFIAFATEVCAGL